MAGAAQETGSDRRESLVRLDVGDQNEGAQGCRDVQNPDAALAVFTDRTVLRQQDAETTQCAGAPCGRQNESGRRPLPPRRVARALANRKHTLRETREAYLNSECIRTPRRCGPAPLANGDVS